MLWIKRNIFILKAKWKPIKILSISSLDWIYSSFLKNIYSKPWNPRNHFHLYPKFWRRDHKSELLWFLEGRNRQIVWKHVNANCRDTVCRINRISLIKGFRTGKFWQTLKKHYYQAQGQGQGQRQGQTSKLDPEVGFVMGWPTHPPPLNFFWAVN